MKAKHALRSLAGEPEKAQFLDVRSAILGHRYYSPTLGRFINKDPIEEPGGLNLYAFCGNNGVNRWDYLGMTATVTQYFNEGEYSDEAIRQYHSGWQAAGPGLWYDPDSDTNYFYTVTPATLYPDEVAPAPSAGWGLQPLREQIDSAFNQIDAFKDLVASTPASLYAPNSPVGLPPSTGSTLATTTTGQATGESPLYKFISIPANYPNNTVVTDGRGGLVVRLGRNPVGESTYVINSIKVHEGSHILDAYNYNNGIANGLPAGLALTPSTYGEKSFGEIRASQRQLDYLNTALSTPNLHSYDRMRIGVEITFAQGYKTYYENMVQGAPQSLLSSSLSPGRPPGTGGP